LIYPENPDRYAVSQELKRYGFSRATTSGSKLCDAISHVVQISSQDAAVPINRLRIAMWTLGSASGSHDQQRQILPTGAHKNDLHGNLARQPVKIRCPA
jgi:hypothetical protein